MAPIFGSLFGVISVFAEFMVLMLIATGIMLAVNGIVRKRRKQAMIGWILCFGTIFATLGFIYQDRIVPLRIQARDIMSLPLEADVVSVEHGDWAGDGAVEFRLPNDRPVIQWFPIVWNMNRDENTTDPAASGGYWVSDYNDEHRELTYDPATQIYRYEVRMPS